MSNLPSVLAYPEILTLDQCPEIKGQYVYVIEDYHDDGLAVMIKRENGNVNIKFGDWNGVEIDFLGDHPMASWALEFTQDHAPNFTEMMRILGIDQIMVYLSIGEDNWTLVDLRASLNKFYGPGMVKDLFSKIFPTQKVRTIVSLDEEKLEAIKKNTGSFKGNLILKCSKFKTITREKRMLPLYARILR